MTRTELIDRCINEILALVEQGEATESMVRYTVSVLALDIEERCMIDHLKGKTPWEYTPEKGAENG